MKLVEASSASTGGVPYAQETARQCTTRQAHTHTAISALPTHKARAMLTCTAVHHASGTHTHRAYETALHTKFAHIRYALTSYFSWLLPHTPPQLRFVWEDTGNGHYTLPLRAEGLLRATRQPRRAFTAVRQAAARSLP